MGIPSIGYRVQTIKQNFMHTLGLPFHKMLPPARMDAALQAEEVTYRHRVFSPPVTVWAFLSQVLDKDKTCKNAVSRILSFLASQGEALPSPDPSAYSQARQRLPEGLVQRLCLQSADRLEAQVSSRQLWKGRSVQIIDGSTVLLPDTAQNQAAYPQHGNQKPGCGFPIVRIVGLFSLVTGAMSNLLMGTWKTHELPLARPLYATLRRGTIVLGDALFGSYADFWLLGHHRLDGLFQLHGARKTDFQRGQRLDKNDHLATWTKPKQRSQGVAADLYAQLAPTQIVRELRYTIQRPGYRARTVTLVTLLTRPASVSAPRARAIVWPALAGRTGSATSQDHDADGILADKNTSDGAQRTGHPLVGV